MYVYEILSAYLNPGTAKKRRSLSICSLEAFSGDSFEGLLGRVVVRMVDGWFDGVVT